jgi:hypothetical protein
MRDHERRGRAPAVVSDVGESDSDAYMVRIRETDAEDPQETTTSQNLS